MWARILKHDLRLPLFTLACASVVGVALIGARIVVSFHAQHLNLMWNLFLAWIPLLLALRIENLDRRDVSKRGEFWLTVGAWLLFFPNAPYIFTDLTHLKHIVNARWWTDLIIILFFALIGLVLGFISLHRMQAVVVRRHGSLTGWAFVLTVAFLSGFGVYLGRFERWNSWGVLVNPAGLLA